MSDTLTNELKALLHQQSHGMALVGIASVDRFSHAPKGHRPGDFIPGAQVVVSIAIPIVSGLMRWSEFLRDSEIIKDVDTYPGDDGKEIPWSPRTVILKHVERRCGYEVVNNELQAMSMYAAIFLEQKGCESVHMPTTYGQTLSWPSSYKWDFPRPPREFAPFSHRHAAVAAGLGTFGLNKLLLTPQYGPRQRLVSIITQAPLEPDPMLSEPVCLGTKCSLCIKECPAQAFERSEEVDVYGVKSHSVKFHKSVCNDYYKGSPFGTQCGRQCITSCPLASIKQPKE